jgi:transposase
VERQRVPRNGRTIKEAAALTGLHPATIRRWTSEPRSVYESRAVRRRERVIELRKLGWTVRAIAAELNVSVGLVSTRLSEAKSAGIDLTPTPQ